MEIEGLNQEPIGYFDYKPTHYRINVYDKIGWFKRVMIKFCFGLEYIKYK